MLAYGALEQIQLILALLEINVKYKLLNGLKRLQALHIKINIIRIQIRIFKLLIHAILQHITGCAVYGVRRRECDIDRRAAFLGGVQRNIYAGIIIFFIKEILVRLFQLYTGIRNSRVVFRKRRCLSKYSK